jgi:hypothetical protein
MNIAFQTRLYDQHAELVADIELVAERANAARSDPKKHAAYIVEAAEIALVRLLDAWRKSRGGTQNNLFFDPLSKRLRRIITAYRKHTDAPAAEMPEEPNHWVYKITNYEAIPFHRLKPFFRASAVDEAIKIGILLGLRELPGVQIWKEEEPDE